jgi:hypothetical protein
MKHDPRLDKMEDYLHTDQRSICTSDAPYILIEGVAGSRKTDTLVRLGLRRHLREKKNILFLTQVGSVTDEICSRVSQYLQMPVYRQASSNHHLVLSQGKTVEIANFDAWIHRQLQDQEWKFLTSMGSYHTFKATALSQLENFRGFCLKNGVYADDVLIDECQDFSPTKAQLIVSLLQKVPHVRAVFCGDYMQTIFEQSFETDQHPMTIFSSLGCQQFSMQKCFRCPAGHISFCNLLLQPAFDQYQYKPLIATNHNHHQKPFLFTHGSTSKKYDVHLLVAQLCAMVEWVMKQDKDLRPWDFCFMMRKSNNQPVFEALRLSLEQLWLSYGYTNSVIHFMTQYDGYRNSIQWNHAINKSCLISIHGDKGKGHKVVFFIGLTQRSIPDECAMHKEKELLYHSLLNVALTRSTKYLFVGFHYAQPSMYLTQALSQLENLTYPSWIKNHFSEQVVSRFPKPDFVQLYRKQPLQIPTLNLLSIVDISRRFERPEDIFGFNPKVKAVVFGKRVRFHYSDEVYTILTRMCELIMLKELHPTLFQKDIAWFPNDVFFTDDERLLSWAHDFHLSKWIHTDSYNQQINLIINTYQHILDHDVSLRNQLTQLQKNHKHVLHSCFNTPRFHQHLVSFTENKETPSSWWDLALLFHPVYHQKHLLSMELPMAPFQGLFHNIKAFIQFLSKEIVFRPCHDILATISDPNDLLKLGFDRELDEKYFEHGYHYGIVGTSSILDVEKKCLYDMKVSPVDFSMEWFMQTSFHANIPTKKTQPPPEKVVVVNFMTGKMHSWDNTFSHPRKLLKRIMKVYSFSEPLFDNLYRMNHHRFKRYQS